MLWQYLLIQPYNRYVEIFQYFPENLIKFESEQRIGCCAMRTKKRCKVALRFAIDSKLPSIDSYIVFVFHVVYFKPK